MTDARQVVRQTVAERGFFGGAEPTQIDERTWFVPSFANASVLETDDGLVMVDTGLVQMGPRIHETTRKLTQAPLHTVVFSHGHVDHAFGLAPWLEEAQTPPRIVAHANVPRRFQRYRRMQGLNEHINSVQFGIDGVGWPQTYFWPDTTYEHALTLTIGGERFELRHGKGETDDATWLWAPERGVLCTGDFWISCAPNCGNPQKVQRYPEEWAEALEAMAALDAQALLPGHGPVIKGAEEVKAALTDAAAYLRSIVEQTLQALNEGLTHEEIVARVKPPAELADRAYLQPIYDRPEFIVRNLIRLHAGWWDGYPSTVLPAAPDARAREIVALAGGTDKLIERATALAIEDIALACHLAEWAALAEPDNTDAQACVRDVFRRRAEQEGSLMGRGIFMHAVRQAERRLA